MSWYGKTSSKQLDTLLEKKPKLSELLLYSEFLTELKAFNSKLLDYLSSNPVIFQEGMKFLTNTPQPNDSNQRKYKLPLMMVQMVETQTTCILNTFFKQIPNDSDTVYFDLMFSGSDNGQVLPLLVGYIFRICLGLLNNRQKQVVDRIYKNNKIFFKLIQNSYYMASTNILQLFLNLDINKHQSGNNSEERAKIKVQTMQRIINKIQMQSLNRKQKSSSIIENLCGILCQTIQKYYLIVDGKQLMDTITCDKTISIIMSLIRSPNSQYAFPGFNFCISLINYYSFSSFNVDDIATQSGKKTLQKLQNQPLICQLSLYFQTALQKITRSGTMTLYMYHLLEVLCHCISISSFKIFQCIRKTKFFSCLIKLLLAHEKNNILHKLIEKSFLHIFISDRKIYSQYKKHLFCELDIIDFTAGQFLRMFPGENSFAQSKKKHYFGHFMRILKIYSGIQTKDEDIVGAIRNKSDVWNRISTLIIKPYEDQCENKLGTHKDIPQPTYQQFKVTKNFEANSRNQQSNSTIEEIKKQQTAPVPATIVPTSTQNNNQRKQSLQMSQKKQEEKLASNLFSASESNNTSNQLISTPIVSNIKPRQTSHMSQSNVIDYRTEQKQLKKSQSFKQFMDKKKVEAEQEIRLKRSLSQEKKLSGSKVAKMSSPSPTKKNSWREQSIDEKDADKKKAVPKIPLNRKPLAQSSASQRKFKEQNSFDDRSTKSLINMDELRKIKVYQIDKPSEKKYRRIQQKDKILLNFLGLPV